MAFEGMDVDQAQSLGRQLGYHAQALAQISAAAADLAAQLSLYWRGPAAATFHQEWEGRHRPALTATAHALSDMHARLTVNIREQQQASAAAAADAGTSAGGTAGVSTGLVGGALLGGSLASKIVGGYDAADKRALRFEPLTWKPREAMKALGDNKWVTGRYTKNWDQVRGAWRELSGNPESKLMDFKSWKVTQWGHDVLPGVAEGAEKVTGPLTVLAVGVDGVRAARDAYHGDVFGTVDESSKILKSFPDTYLFGVGLSLADDAVQTGMHTDWNQGILPGLGSMAGKMSHHVLNILLP